MKHLKEFPFDKARRISDKEVSQARKAIENKLNVKRPKRGRPLKLTDKYKPISIRLHPKVLEWVKKLALKRGVGYQTIINEILFNSAA